MCDDQSYYAEYQPMLYVVRCTVQYARRARKNYYVILTTTPRNTAVRNTVTLLELA